MNEEDRPIGWDTMGDPITLKRIEGERAICLGIINRLAEKNADGMLNLLSVSLFDWHNANGFWPQHDSDLEPSVKLSKLMLMVTELAEAAEGIRKPGNDDKLTTRPATEVELADAIIRILDYAGAYRLDIGGALLEKMRFNVNRPFRHGKTA